MALILDGTNGLSDVDGSAATPAIRGTDANTGIFFPAADTIAFSEGGAESMRLDSAGNVGIGTTSPTDTSLFTRALDLNGTSGAAYYARTNGSATSYTLFGNFGTDGYINNRGAGNLLFYTNNNVERMRITSDGRVLINNTGSFGGRLQSTGTGGLAAAASFKPGNNGDGTVEFYNSSNGYVSAIQVNASTVVYGTGSDYRLKDNIAPMTGALNKVIQLKPVTWNWKVDGEGGQGFIAHELQEVVPDAVTGVKDAVETYTDEDGNEQTRIKPQGIDTSFLVATLTAAIQELKATVDAQAARIAALEAAE
jgi:hypothetical protein